MLYNIMITLFQICGILLCITFIITFIKSLFKYLKDFKNED